MNSAPADASWNMAQSKASPDPRSETRAELVRLAQGYSIEMSPHEQTEPARVAERLGPGRTVYVTSLPGRPFDANLAAAAALARAGLKPVLHLAARRIPSRDGLAEFLSRARGEFPCDDLLLIAGDERRALGPYADSAAVLETGLLGQFGIRRVGLAGYPGGHPFLDANALRAALLRKSTLARASGLEARIVTQFSFEPARIVDFLRAVEASNVGLPVHVGLAGLAAAGTLLKFARRCGVGASFKMLRAHGRELLNLLALAAPDQALLALADERKASHGVRPAAIHFFPFGGVERTTRWADAVARGDFEIERDGTGFAVRDKAG
jgi:methylenetetrahydrofolate reductase (NADPH)